MSQISFIDVVLRLSNEPLADERVSPSSDLRWGVDADLVPVRTDAPPLAPAS